MSWSKDQWHAHAQAPEPAAVDAKKPPAHPARAVMTQRWQERLAQAEARRAEVTASGIHERATFSRHLPPTEQAAAPVSEPTAPQTPTPLPKPSQSGLSNTGRAMLIVALLAHGVLLALLYLTGLLR